MKVFIFALALFASFNLKAQCADMTRPVKGVLATKFGKDSMDWYWNVADLPGISASVYPIEIRLYAHGLIDGTCYQLYCDGNKFGAQVSSWDTGSGFKTIMQPVSANADLKQIFHDLVKNKIFDLPDEREVNFEKSARDGIHYVLEYKVGNICRRYKFSNPRTYHKYYPKIRVIGYYNNVSALLQSLDRVN